MGSPARRARSRRADGVGSSPRPSAVRRASPGRAAPLSPGKRTRYSPTACTPLAAASILAPVLEPLSAPVAAAVPVDRAAAGPDAAPVHEAPVFATYKWAGGGMLSTADDLARFGAAHLRPGFHSAASLRALLTPQRTRDGAGTGVGLGWRVGADLAGRTVYHHAGTIEGGRAALLVYPAEGVVVALLTNRTAAVDSPELMAQLLAEPFLPRVATAPRAGRGAATAGAGAGGVYRVRLPGAGGAAEDVRLAADGHGVVPSPPALRERARQAGLPMPATLPVLGGAAGAAERGPLVVASPLGLHALRPTDADGRPGGQLVVALEGPALRPVAARIEGPPAAARAR